MIIAIDIGGTTTRVASIINEKIIKRTKFSTVPNSFPQTFAKICQIITKFCHHDFLKIEKIGICCPGPLDIEKGVILNPPNLKGWKNIKIKDQFSLKFPNVLVKIDNDANVAALGQFKLLKKAPESLLFFTFSTGIGSGFILNQQIYHGFSYTALEIANALPDYSYHLDGVQSGVEYFAGGNGIVQQSKNLGFPIANTKEIFDLFYDNNTSVKTLFTVIEDKIVSLLATSIYILNPEIIIIGGSVALNNQAWMNEIFEKVLRTTKDIKYKTKFKFAKNIEKSTLIGCSVL